MNKYNRLALDSSLILARRWQGRVGFTEKGRGAWIDVGTFAVRRQFPRDAGENAAVTIGVPHILWELLSRVQIRRRFARDAEIVGKSGHAKDELWIRP
jgi:hypothetical protein